MLHDLCLAGFFAEERCIPRPEIVSTIDVYGHCATDGWVEHIFFSGIAWGYKARVPTPVRDVAEVLKAAAKPLAMLSHTGGVSS